MQFFLLIYCIVSAEKIHHYARNWKLYCVEHPQKQLRNAYHKITPNLLFEYQCTSGKFIRLPNRIESKKSPICPKAPPSTDLHQIWRSRRGRRHNHLYQIFWWSVKGCLFCGGSKIAISHWQKQSPLTQGWRYRAARENLAFFHYTFFLSNIS